MPASRQGTNFTNLQTYLGLNQGSAKWMGDALADDVEAAGSKAAAGIQSEADRTSAAIKENTFQMPGTGPLTSQQATELGERTYDGPYGMDPTVLSRLYGQATAAQNQATALGSNTGRAALLQKKFGANTWGGGQLDGALAGAGGAGGRLSAAHGAYGRLVGTLGGAQSSLQQQGRAAADATGKAAKAYQDMVPGLQQREEAAIQAEKDRNEASRRARRAEQARRVAINREAREPPEEQRTDILYP